MESIVETAKERPFRESWFPKPWLVLYVLAFHQLGKCIKGMYYTSFNTLI